MLGPNFTSYIFVDRVEGYVVPLGTIDQSLGLCILMAVVMNMYLATGGLKSTDHSVHCVLLSDQFALLHSMF